MHEAMARAPSDPAACKKTTTSNIRRMPFQMFPLMVAKTTQSPTYIVIYVNLYYIYAHGQ